jgi:hypothetical protein
MSNRWSEAHRELIVTDGDGARGTFSIYVNANTHPLVLEVDGGRLLGVDFGDAKVLRDKLDEALGDAPAGRLAAFRKGVEAGIDLAQAGVRVTFP